MTIKELADLYVEDRHAYVPAEPDTAAQTR